MNCSESEPLIPPRTQPQTASITDNVQFSRALSVIPEDALTLHHNHSEIKKDAAVLSLFHTPVHVEFEVLAHNNNNGVTLFKGHPLKAKRG